MTTPFSLRHPGRAASWPLLLAGLAALAVVAVVVLPELGTSLPGGNDPEPNEAQAAVTAVGVVAITAAYVFATARRAGLDNTWASLTLAFCAAIATVKFAVSPGSFRNSSQFTLSEYITVGLGVMVLYGAGWAGIYWMARRHGLAGWVSKALVVAGVIVFAVIGRYLAVVVLGSDASDYLSDIFREGWLMLLGLLAGAALAAIGSFERAEVSGGQAAVDLTLRVGLAVIAVYHGLWAIFMLRLFD